MSDNNPVSTVIPYTNPLALAAYYTGIFSLIPCLGGLLGPIGFILGILGLKKAGNQPESKGKVHAWIGILVGGLTGLVHLAFGVMILLDKM